MTVMWNKVVLWTCGYDDAYWRVASPSLWHVTCTHAYSFHDLYNVMCLLAWAVSIYSFRNTQSWSSIIIIIIQSFIRIIAVDIIAIWVAVQGHREAFKLQTSCVGSISYVQGMDHIIAIWMLFALLLRMGITLLLQTLNVVCSVALNSDFGA